MLDAKQEWSSHSAWILSPWGRARKGERRSLRYVWDMADDAGGMRKKAVEMDEEKKCKSRVRALAEVFICVWVG